MLEKTYCEDYTNNKCRINNGERDQYYSASNNAPVILDEKFKLVPKETSWIVKQAHIRFITPI